MYKNALVSVSDKTNLDIVAKFFAKHGTTVVSTGGTAKSLKSMGVKVTEISEFTGFPEIMDGRVKTLHPRVHMALLARQDSKEDQAILKENSVTPFDLVIVNLYPFEEEPGIETIDIGGPTLLRAAAKSNDRIVVLSDPVDYARILNSERQPDQIERRHLAGKVFRHVSSYDAMIADWFSPGVSGVNHSWGGSQIAELRYGENPHQKAHWLRTRGVASGLHDAKILHGKALSYNNLLDLNAAVKTVRSLAPSLGVVAVKHNNPCGVATGNTVAETLDRALKADPKSVFGGIVAINGVVDRDSASLLKSIFLECIVATGYSDEALEVLTTKKDLRILSWPDLIARNPNASYEYEMRSVDGGILLQSGDVVPQSWQNNWASHGAKPNDLEKRDILFAWQVCANLKSNAICIAHHGQTLGLGMGQVNRVDAVKQAIERWKEYHPEAKSPVLASDAFFPFADSIDLMSEAGVKWVIQPGGSIRDEEVLARASQLGVNLVLTGERHFSH